MAEDLADMQRLCRAARDEPAGISAQRCLARARTLLDRHLADAAELAGALEGA
jgi:hypothetical protein